MLYFYTTVDVEGVYMQVNFNESASPAYSCASPLDCEHS